MSEKYVVLSADLKHDESTKNVHAAYSEFDIDFEKQYGVMYRIDSDFQNQLLVVVLREVINSLKLIDAYMPISGVHYKSHTTKDRCTKPPSILHSYPPALHDMGDFGFEVYKFQFECQNLMHHLNILLRGISKSGHFGMFVKAVDSLHNQMWNEDQVLLKRDYCHERMEHIAHILVQENVLHQKKFMACARRIGELKDGIEAVREYERVRERYNDRWQASREYQNSATYNKYIEKIMRDVRTGVREIQREKRVHKEMERFTAVDKKDKEKEIEMWQQRYQNDFEQLTIDIIKLETKRSQLGYELECLRDKYTTICTSIEEVKIMRNEQELARRILKKQTAAAIRIQCWWRGVMVRRGLGPYRKKKRRGKGKKKGSGGKKKGENKRVLSGKTVKPSAKPKPKTKPTKAKSKNKK